MHYATGFFVGNDDAITQLNTQLRSSRCVNNKCVQDDPPTAGFAAPMEQCQTSAFCGGTGYACRDNACVAESRQQLNTMVELFIGWLNELHSSNLEASYFV